MKIVAHSYVNSKGVFLNGDCVQTRVDLEVHFLNDLYRKLELNYPKFYKMDTLSKSALLADFVLTPYYTEKPELEDQLQLIFANDESSKQTDLKFIDSYELKENASPSLFVYTLPNIVTGELAIKHKWYGENTFFILPDFQTKFYVEQMEMSFARGNKYCLCGWMSNKTEENEECFLFLVSQSENKNVTNEIENILNTYRNE
ncbi:MAG: 3-oxoacyl-ACP synthase [Crocinitomicaceae bacterium]